MERFQIVAFIKKTLLLIKIRFKLPCINQDGNYCNKIPCYIPKLGIYSGLLEVYCFQLHLYLRIISLDYVCRKTDKNIIMYLIAGNLSRDL